MPAQLGSRAAFPDLQPRVYANHAAVSPPSLAVQAAAQTLLQDYGARGLGAIHDWMAQRERLRGKLGGLLNVPAERLALTASTGRGLMDLANCLPWEPDDRVLCFEGEFPANVTPWRQAAQSFGGRFTLLPQPRSDADVLAVTEQALKQGARYLAVSAVQFQTGRRMPLSSLTELAHRHGAEVIVDGIQAVGVVPMDLQALGVDYLAGGAHKWLMGLEGCGYLYVAPGKTLVPRVAGWLSHTDPVDFLMKGAGHLRYDRPVRSRPDFLEIGSTNALGFAAFEAGLDPILELGVPAIHAHVQRWNAGVEEALVARGFRSHRDATCPSGTLSLDPPAGEDTLVIGAHLASQGIAASTPDGLLRLSPHWPNSLDELPVLLAAIDGRPR